MPLLQDVPPDFPESTPDPVPPAREEIGIVTNGQTGVGNPERQSLSNALLDGLNPLNLLGDEVPGKSPQAGTARSGTRTWRSGRRQPSRPG